MNESSVSSAFQTALRKALPGAVVIKHADKSMIGMPDASVTFNKKTLWIEYKFITPTTKGVNWRDFMNGGEWYALAVVEESLTQYGMMQALAKAGHAIYLFWVLDHQATRKKIKEIRLYFPLLTTSLSFVDTEGIIQWLRDFFSNKVTLPS